MKVAVIDYGAGNMRSVEFALERLGVSPDITADGNVISSADKVIFPGVGEASSAMKVIRDLQLDDVIKNLEQPVLGICLGMQLMCDSTAEGNTKGLGIFQNKVKQFNDQLKVPHMGWNQLNDLKSDLFDQVSENNDVYFVHSFYADVNDNTIAVTDYGIQFSAALHKDNFYGCQFHPEKSGTIGARILKTFIGL